MDIFLIYISGFVGKGDSRWWWYGVWVRGIFFTIINYQYESLKTIL
jgi:hypothetical protein